MVHISHKLKGSRGYTLPEALISVLLLSFILLGVYGVLVTGNVVTTGDNALLDMQQQARAGMDRMLREIRESSTTTITMIDANSYRIAFSTPNETGINYYRSGTNLLREYPTGMTKIVATNIAYLKFAASASLMQINIRADKAVGARTYSFPLAMKVRLRNE